jgi:hypothetical protein
LVFLSLGDCSLRVKITYHSEISSYWTMSSIKQCQPFGLFFHLQLTLGVPTVFDSRVALRRPELEVFTKRILELGAMNP